MAYHNGNEVYYIGNEFRQDPLYQEQYLVDEPEFLEAMVIQLRLYTHECDPLVFKSRFQDAHLDLERSDIVEIIQPEFEKVYLNRFPGKADLDQSDLFKVLTKYYGERLYKGIRPKLQKLSPELEKLGVRPFYYEDGGWISEWIAVTKCLFEEHYPLWRQRKITRESQKNNTGKPSKDKFSVGTVSESDGYNENPNVETLEKQLKKLNLKEMDQADLKILDALLKKYT